MWLILFKNWMDIVKMWKDIVKNVDGYCLKIYTDIVLKI